MKLDYILFAGPGVEAIETKVLKNGGGVSPFVDLMASDHRPLIATFLVGGAESDKGGENREMGKRLETHFDSPPTWRRLKYDLKLLAMFIVVIGTIVAVIVCA